MNLFSDQENEPTWWKRKKALWEKEKGSIVNVKGYSEPYQIHRYDHKTEEKHLIHLRFLIKQNDHYHIEEQIIPYRFIKKGKDIHFQEEQPDLVVSPSELTIQAEESEIEHRQSFNYDRREAVRYADRWWNDYNPAFRRFEVDCTNYISQCLLAGGAPMRGAPNRENGWWYQQDQWSYSWAVAHSMRWYLSGSTTGLKGVELDDAEELLPGDVICYDFQGDGRYDHTTIVVNKDAFGMPLVNAHTDNSRNRYWTYEDSMAWTPNIQYKFFRIGD